MVICLLLMFPPHPSVESECRIIGFAALNYLGKRPKTSDNKSAYLKEEQKRTLLPKQREKLFPLWQGLNEANQRGSIRESRRYEEKKGKGRSGENEFPFPLLKVEGGLKIRREKEGVFAEVLGKKGLDQRGGLVTTLPPSTLPFTVLTTAASVVLFYHIVQRGNVRFSPAPKRDGG